MTNFLLKDTHYLKQEGFKVAAAAKNLRVVLADHPIAVREVAEKVINLAHISPPALGPLFIASPALLSRRKRPPAFPPVWLPIAG